MSVVTCRKLLKSFGLFLTHTGQKIMKLPQFPKNVNIFWLIQDKKTLKLHSFPKNVLIFWLTADKKARKHPKLTQIFMFF
ncbi:MAG: hypothetical protein DRN71_06040 [Candidatus Nanohalarchaeota archaeon]|nr:MAG: hypothetical protein DRN71_06040 [Candidatus Nanohaloarchaeota archaeon]